MRDVYLEALKDVERMLSSHPENELKSLINGSMERVKKVKGGVQYEGQIDDERSIYTAKRIATEGVERLICTRDRVAVSDGVILQIFKKATVIRDAVRQSTP